MFAPRSARLPARLLLAGFALALWVAGLAPLLRPAGGVERLCSASGSPVWLPSSLAASPQDQVHGLDCALCLPPLLPLGERLRWAGKTPAPSAPDQRLHPGTHALPLSRAPFPPRAPPRACA